MKGRFLEALIAAQGESRSVALATELASGRQLLLDADRTEGDLALDPDALAAMREALRTDRNVTLETPAGETPAGRGEEPQVLTTVASATPCPASCQRAAWPRMSAVSLIFPSPQIFHASARPRSAAVPRR